MDKTKPLILVAEDNFVNRTILKKILEQQYNIMEANDGTSALHKIKKNCENLTAIIIDLIMPGVSGEEILQEVSRDVRCQGIPILVATGERDPQVEHRCLQLGAWDFITKPYDAKILKLRLENIIARKESSLLNRIRYLSQRDKLTGIYNRDYFLEQTQGMIKYHPEKSFALIRMDIDRFRLYNASFGKVAGDDLLRKFAKSIASQCEVIHHCTYGRIESDVFCICISYDHDIIIKGIEKACESVHLISSNYRLELSFGIYIIDKPNQNVEEAYSYSSEAAKKCKDNLNLHYVFYDEKMKRKQMLEQFIRNEMENAIKEEQFKVYIQPKYCLIDDKPFGGEALVRWFHPEKGMISPGEFIPIFEQNGFINELDHYMWKNVCILLRKWIDAGYNVCPISVNISRISLYNPSIVDDLIGLVEKYDIPYNLLNLELTESAYMSNPELMKTVISKLRASGFVLMMDDFGSGFSSLNTLKDIDMDILKIDMKFLPSGEQHVKSEKILASIARMAAWLKMPVVIEGVETKEQRDFVLSIGCQYVQGYFYAHPMPVNEYEEFIKLKEEHIKDSRNTISKEELLKLDAIWSADAKTGQILKSVAVPFAIIEFSDTGSDVLRMNQAYMDVFGSERNHLSLLNYKQRVKLHEGFVSAIENDRAIVQCSYNLNNGVKWYEINLSMLAMIANSYILAVTFSDVTKEHSHNIELQEVINVIKEPIGKKVKMLIVANNNLNYLAKIFKGEYEILIAQDNQSAYEILNKESINIAIILLDLRYDLMQEFINNKNEMDEAVDIPIVIISNDDSIKMQEEMLKVGVKDYIVKPFIDLSIVRRIKNVLEYSNRFRTMVREYNDSLLLENTKHTLVQSDDYKISDINGMIDFMKNVFDVVRIVDPQKMVILNFLENGMISESEYSCFDVWGKEKRCKNCTSICALQKKSMISKYEFIKNDIFYVISQPIRVINKGNTKECILEVVSHISEHIITNQENTTSIASLLKNTRDKIYHDSLTGAFNRRYYDEIKFITGDEKCIALVLFDMYHFKEANDLYGHSEGDRILIEVARVINEQIRGDDSLIRYGGDEFVVILKNCNNDKLPLMVERLSDAINKITYGDMNKHAHGNYGYSISNNFIRDPIYLREMFNKADKMMYENKRRYGKRND